ncbi:MAG: GFA family protein [Comamonadaceae bacterium]|nr:MAG: GFA family protein [Comamonadaceae bacterium]
MKYTGSCHCGNVKFEAEGEPIESVLACNCSICQRLGSLLWFVPRGQFTLQTPEDNAGTYLFNKHLIRHRFCKTCGIQPYAEATAPDGKPMAAVNVRCIEGIDLAAIPVNHYDGRSK